MSEDTRSGATGTHPTSSPPRPHGLPAPLLGVLTRPAIVRVGDGVLPVECRLWLDWLLLQAQAALRTILRQPVHLRIADERACQPAEPDEFAAELYLPGSEGRGSDYPLPAGRGSGLRVSFDRSAARTLVDALLCRTRGLRGCGSLTDGECGVLEYVLLAVAERVSRTLPTSCADWAFRGFWGPGEAAAREESRGSGDATLRMELAAAGQSGYVTVQTAADWRGADLALVASNGATAATRGESRGSVGSLHDIVKVGVALPVLPLSPEECAALAPGDVLLCGASTLQSFAADLALVTLTGWRLATAEWVADSPTHVSVRCGALAPTFHAARLPAAENGPRTIQPILGRRPLTIEQIARWKAGDVLDLPKSLDAPLLLVSDGRGAGPGRGRPGAVCGTGELVRLDGELGIRILTLEPGEGEPEACPQAGT